MFYRYGKIIALFFFSISSPLYARVDINLVDIFKSEKLPQTERFKHKLEIANYAKADAYLIWASNLKKDLSDYTQNGIYEQLIWLMKNILKEYRFQNAKHDKLLIRLSSGMDKEHFCFGLSLDDLSKLKNRDFGDKDVKYAKSNKLPLITPLKEVMNKIVAYKSCIPLDLNIDYKKSKIFSTKVNEYWFSSNELFVEDAYQRYRKTKDKILDYIDFGDINGLKRYINYGYSLRKRDSGGYTLLSIASSIGNIDIVKLLLKHNVNINEKNNDGSTALIQATLSNHLNVVKLLVKKGANPNIYPSGFENSYMAAKRKGYSKIASYLKPLTNKLSNVVRSSSSSSSSRSNEVDFVSVEAGIGVFSGLTKNLQMSPSDPNAFIGEFKPNFSHARSGAIYKGLNGIAGYYNYSFQSGDDKVTCSGRIYVSGRKQNLRFSVGRDCQDLSSGEF